MKRQLLEPCLDWRGAVSRDGYAKFGKRLVHRVIYEEAFGPQTGLEIDHLCFNRSCVNLEHMEAVTRKENMRRREGRKYVYHGRYVRDKRA